GGDGLSGATRPDPPHLAPRGLRDPEQSGQPFEHAPVPEPGFVSHLATFADQPEGGPNLAQSQAIRLAHRMPVVPNAAPPWPGTRSRRDARITLDPRSTRSAGGPGSQG